MKVSGFRAIGLFSFYSQLLFNQAVVSSYFHYHSFSVEDESVQSLLCLLPVMDSSGFLDSVASHSLFILPRSYNTVLGFLSYLPALGIDKSAYCVNDLKLSHSLTAIKMFLISAPCCVTLF